MNINRSIQNHIRKQIPIMTRNIHEGVWSGLRSAASAIGGAITNEYRRLSASETMKSIERARRIEDTVLLPHYSERLGIHVNEMKRLRDEVTHPGSPPPSTIKDPNTGHLVANPNYSALLAQHQSRMEDWNKKMEMEKAIAGINATNRSIGSLHATLYGNYKPGYTPPPGVVGAPPAIPSSGTRGRYDYLQRKIP